MNVSHDQEVSEELKPQQLMWMGVMFQAKHDATSIPNLKERRSIIAFQTAQEDAREWLFNPEHAEGRDRAEHWSGVNMPQMIRRVRYLIEKGLTDPRWRPPIKRRRNRA